nr:uncharacterized protein LOC108945586 [Nicotiana tomentosiformis]
MAQSSLLECIKARQFDDPHLLVLKDTVQRGVSKELEIGDDGVKYQHQKPGGLNLRLEIPEWKRERIIMDFVVGLPQNLRKYDAIWVIMDWLTKSAHFIPVVTSYSSVRLAQIYIQEIIHFIRLLGTDLVCNAMDTVKVIWERLHTAHSIHQSYAYWKVRDISYMMGEKRVGEVAYKNALPLILSGVHSIFHVSIYRKYHEDNSHVLDFSTVQVDVNFAYEEETMAIRARQVRKLRSKSFPSVKV